MTLIQDPSAIRAIAKNAKRVAVLGIKTEDAASQPAFYVPQSLAQQGVDILAPESVAARYDGRAGIETMIAE